jgi:5'-nucleotidase
LHRPLRATELRPGWFSIDGTPADCVYLALYHLLPRLPELAISGINLGYNLGSDVFYSGTVAAAAEAAIRGVPAIAVSLEWSGQPDFAPVAALAHALARGVLERGLPSRTLINLNAPTRPGPLRYAWTGLGQRVYREQVEARTDLRGQHYYWIGGPPQGFGDVAGSDCHSVRDGIASLTPLDLDLTHHGLLEQLPNWRLEGAEQVEG